MSNIDPNKQNNAVSITNPLQTNNTATMLVGYLAGIAAAKLPWFDFATWNYIIMGIGGIVFTAYTAIINRKTAVVSVAANLPEVKNIELDKNVAGTIALNDATPNNVKVV